MTGASIDSLATLVLAAAAAALLGVVTRRWPQAALAVWLITLAFVPVWLTVHLIIDIPPATAVGFIALTAAIPSAIGRIVWADVLVVFFFIASLIPFFLGFGTIATFVTVFTQWLLGYALGRLFPLRIGVERTYRWIGGVCTAVAVGALVEFVTGWNPFVGLSRANGDYDTWGTLQERGGLVRAEWAFGHSIALGASLALAIPIVLAATLRTSVRISMVLTLLGGVVVTLSRGGLVSAILGLVLSVLFLPSGIQVSRRLRVGAALALTVGVVAVSPWLLRVFSDASDEAQTSAAYRLDLLGLITEIEPIGASALAMQTEQSRELIGASVDNAWLLLGLRYGAVALIICTVLLVGATLTVLARRATAPTVAIVAGTPTLFTVALITQFSMWIWFVAGLAVASQAVRAQQSDPMHQLAGFPTARQPLGSASST